MRVFACCMHARAVMSVCGWVCVWLWVWVVVGAQARVSLCTHSCVCMFVRACVFACECASARACACTFQIVFTTDHAALAKGEAYEHGCRVPFIIR